MLIMFYVKCPNCKGFPLAEDVQCAICKGKGYVAAPEKIHESKKNKINIHGNMPDIPPFTQEGIK